jgi:Ca-activated chloride channel family protein
VTLAKPEKADRDFILRWRTDGDWRVPAVVAHRPEADGDGWFTLMLAPPVEGPPDAAREITFIMDISGSMSGQPIECSKRLVAASLDALNPRDKFNVFFFSGGNGQVFQSPVPATAENIGHAKSQVENFRAGGGTEMLAGLQRALEAKHDDRYTQTYAFLTDGFVGEVDAILRYVQQFGDKVQFFAFGVGYSVNRALIDGIAESANGRAIYYVPDVNVELDLAPIDAFLGSIRNPVAASPAIDWGKLPVSDVTPGKLGNVYNGQVLAVTGRYSKAASDRVRVTWLVDGVEQSTEFTLDLPEIETANAALPRVWAAGSIHDCELQLLAAPDSPDVLERLMETSLTHGLSTRWTSFVAVDEFTRHGGGKPRTVVQPVEVPTGVDRKQVGR